jgi:hypothetical protein
LRQRTHERVEIGVHQQARVPCLQSVRMPNGGGDVVLQDDELAALISCAARAASCPSVISLSCVATG